MNIDLNNYRFIYFIGAGGIGMSNLVRYFLSKGIRVAGYDKTATALTAELIKEGADIHFEDNLSRIPSCFMEDSSATLVVYTPAVPSSHSELVYFQTNGFAVVKRAQLLGLITRTSMGLCVAGTHGKTTTSSMLAHLLHQSSVDCNAFLGGILKNYQSNLILSDSSPYTVIEADEYDRSFHWLTPYAAVITSADPDHLDIYHTEEAYLESFAHFTSLIRPDGILLMKEGIHVTPRCPESTKQYSYSIEGNGDFKATNIRIGNGTILFDFVSPLCPEAITNIELGVPVEINIENAVAAMAIAQLCGASSNEMRTAMASFEGAKRRFDIHLKQGRQVMIDDYGHHPAEVLASIRSVKRLFADRQLTVIFQPHLYSRTADFHAEFAEALSYADELILLDIYPAREEPIEGITSQLIFDRVHSPLKTLCVKDDLMKIIRERDDREVVMTLGAGDIDQFIQPIKEHLQQCGRK